MGEIFCSRCLSKFRLFSKSPWILHRSLLTSKSQLNYYEVLGVKPNASQEEIRAAFVEISKKIHPDKNPNDPGTHDKFIRLNEAYTVLIKPLTRREYDMTLAHRLYTQQNWARNAGSHRSGSYPGPGMSGGQGQYEGGSQERVFWDETLWHMRDKRKDANMQDDEYYGVKGIKKMPNSYVVGGCFVIIAMGFLYFLAGWKWSQRKMKELTEREKKNFQHWKDARARAKLYGDEKTLERIASSIKKNKEKREQVELAGTEALAAVKAQDRKT